MKIFNKRHKTGFTLIELLVVVAIIGLLSSIVILGVGQALALARSASRAAMLKDLSTGLEAGHTAFQQYPSTCDSPPFADLPCAPGSLIKVLNSCDNPTGYVPLLVSNGIMSDLPHDPQELCGAAANFAKISYASNGVDYKIVIWNPEGCEQGSFGIFSNFCRGISPSPRYWLIQTPGAEDWPDLCGSQFPQTHPHDCL